MNVRSIRRITRDFNHNAFLDAQWFQGALYVAFRQGDAHVCDNGKLVVMRSRDDGLSFDTVAVLRGRFDTRDAKLHAIDDRRLFVSGFELENGCKAVGVNAREQIEAIEAAMKFEQANAWNETAEGQPMKIATHPGAAYTDDGLNWTPWQRCTGAEGHVLWQPEYHDGKHYCAGYVESGKNLSVSWFESDDGFDWRRRYTLLESDSQPNETSLVFRADGTATLLVRRDKAPGHPLLMRAKPPYDNWESQDVPAHANGLALWYVGDEIWFSGRWFLSNEAIHVAVFRLENDVPVMKMVLPSGPHYDCAYMGAAQHPDNERRFHLAYYSGHGSCADPHRSQWECPDIYLVDALFE